jgi:hypothetical protein
MTSSPGNAKDFSSFEAVIFIPKAISLHTSIGLWFPCKTSAANWRMQIVRQDYSTITKR